ncbi:MAG TPA: 1-acyl-sn-glycerol-3-phosphate acyltransferase [Gemmatimonadales bacterium]|nr:1-acyl-sn-glycerol-3-phosphate acyltransferase [Gemmatimonadales bacterium]
MRYTGAPVPAEGPVLLVANHPNSLLDPMLVVAAARRQVRFLAKAPLFTDRKIGWLIRASGAIPVYRRSDDPSQMNRNEEMFRAVHAALAAGDVVGIFPEGISHTSPSLAPLRTGAARIALGAAAQLGGAFPVVPIGLVFRNKDVFRSDALVVRASPVQWDDLAGLPESDTAAVAALTERIGDALEQVTLNLAQWRDERLVAAALGIWQAENHAPPGRTDDIFSLTATTRLLGRVRATSDTEGLALAEDVDAHARKLGRLKLRPSDLHLDTGTGSALTWAAARVPLVMPLAAIVALAGWIIFLVPYQLTGVIVDRLKLEPDTRSTWKLLVGLAVYILWLVALISVVWAVGGIVMAVVALVSLPAVGMLGLLVRESWRGSWKDARRWFRLRSRKDVMDALRADQAALGRRLSALQQRLTTTKGAA